MDKPAFVAPPPRTVNYQTNEVGHSTLTRLEHRCTTRYTSARLDSSTNPSLLSHCAQDIKLITTISSIIRPRRSRSAAASSRHTFPWKICRSVHVGPTYVRRSVGLSSALWKNGGSDAVWHRRSDGSRHEAEAGSGVWGSVHSCSNACP